MQERLGKRAGRAVGRLVAGAAVLAHAGCSTMGSVGQTFFGGPPAGATAPALQGFIGAAVADEPRAALAGREVLARGGTAADAAVAIGFMLGVTLPSRAGLGGGGACLAYSPDRKRPGAGNAEAILFTPQQVPGTLPQTDRPAAIPMMARGLYLLHVRYGTLPFESLVTPAEQAARFGIPVPRALLQDLAVVAGPLLQDPNAAAVFAPGGQPLAEGGTLQQADLAATLAQLRTAGVGDLYSGGLAARLANASLAAGGGLVVDDMRKALPVATAPLTLRVGRDIAAFLPPPADGGLAAAGGFQTLQSGGGAQAALTRSLAVAAAWRQRGGDPMAALASGGGGDLPALPASTGWVTMDRDGNSVACVATMDNLFGTGRIAPGTGVLLAAEPRPLPLLSAALVWNPNLSGFRAAVTGTGQEAAGEATAVALFNALRSRSAMAATVPEPGRANVISCPVYLPSNNGSCSWAVDPRSSGLAAGGN